MLEEDEEDNNQSDEEMDKIKISKVYKEKKYEE